MDKDTMPVGACLSGEQGMEPDAFAQACSTATELIRLRLGEVLVRPAGGQPAWRFGGEELARVRHILRLQRDLEANLDSVAVMLEPMDQIEQLRALLRQARIPA